MPTYVARAQPAGRSLTAVGEQVARFLVQVFMDSRCAEGCEDLSLVKLKDSYTYFVDAPGSGGQVTGRAELLRQFVESYETTDLDGTIALSETGDEARADIVFRIEPSTGNTAVNWHSQCSSGVQVTDGVVTSARMHVPYTELDVEDGREAAAADLMFNRCATTALNSVFDYIEAETQDFPSSASVSAKRYWRALLRLRGSAQPSVPLFVRLLNEELGK